MNKLQLTSNQLRTVSSMSVRCNHGRCTIKRWTQRGLTMDSMCLQYELGHYLVVISSIVVSFH